MNPIPGRLSFAHLINTVGKNDNAALQKVQELTVRTMLAAAEKLPSHVSVQFLSAQFADARGALPPQFRYTDDLKISAADKAELGTKLRLPVLREIISRFKEAPDATHYVFTNLDICLMPYFYGAVAEYVSEGHDAVIINRRRITATLMNTQNLELLYAEAGETHTGYDCFVFSRELLEKLVLRDIFIGVPPAGNDLFYNLMAFAKNPALLTEKHLTFHVGMDLVKPWGNAALHRHNRRGFMTLLRELKPHFDIAKFPGAGYGFFKRHFKWLMNPTFHYPTMCALDLKQLSRKRRAPKKNELPGLANRYYEWMIRKVNFRDKD